MSKCQELMAPAYFKACLLVRRSLVTRAASAASVCVGDRLTAAYMGNKGAIYLKYQFLLCPHDLKLLEK